MAAWPVIFARMESPIRRTTRAPRTFELRDSRWVEDAGPRRLRPPFWLIGTMALAALAGVALVAFAATAALATGLALRARASLRRLFGG